MRNDSRCPKGILCQFEVSRDLPDAQIEVCVLCGKKVVYRKVDGRVDNAKYTRDHSRDIVQPHGRTSTLFFKIYGRKIYDEAVRRMQKKRSKAAQKKEWDEMRRDLVRRMKRTQL